MGSRTGGLILGLLLLVGTGSLRAEAQPARAPLAAWFDGSSLLWNADPRLPLTEPKQPMDSVRCAKEIRSADSEEERLVEGAGWMLVGPFQRFGDIVLVTGTEGFDGMCRYSGFQVFAFSGGAFIGTLAPEPMSPRTDGTLLEARLTDDGVIVAGFSRYTPKDPLCCPSRYSSVSYRIEHQGASPFLVPDSISTARLPTD
jgi:hypothetical protein